MSEFDKGLQEAENLAKEHPQQADKLIDRGEQGIDQRTDNRYEKEVDAGGQKLEKELGGGTGNAQPKNTQQGSTPPA